MFGRLAIGLVLLLPVVSEAQGVRAATCSPVRTVLAQGFGSPDDLAVRGATIYFTDEVGGSLSSLSGGHMRVIARGLRAPEGIVLETGGKALVVEQGRNRIDQVNLSNGRRSVVLRLTNNTGKEGVDGIAPAPAGEVYVPDSPYGRLWLMDRKRHLHLLIAGLGRPVGAIQFQGGVAVADETANAVWLVRGGRATRLATVSIPDDLAVVNGALLAVTLGDGALWEITPRVQRLVAGLGQPQGLAMLGSGKMAVADSTSNTIIRISGLAGCLG